MKTLELNLTFTTCIVLIIAMLVRKHIDEPWKFKFTSQLNLKPPFMLFSVMHIKKNALPNHRVNIKTRKWNTTQVGSAGFERRDRYESQPWLFAVLSSVLVSWNLVIYRDRGLSSISSVQNAECFPSRKKTIILQQWKSFHLPPLRQNKENIFLQRWRFSCNFPHACSRALTVERKCGSNK